ncbi:MAG: tyrosine-type recombinase/integrase [Acetobacter aceti]|uniref:Tyr recombinase domain-containing protein n=1 Tax=Acetobacter aceti TaxID=435 RepID=A0A1U9KGP5_ACEAC|nr:tyrosine-type recombinase/integrase [Acetobacter aceti]AQS84960.1 hypothetical protein A0U92_09430 [Acetobacter aceti]
MNAPYTNSEHVATEVKSDTHNRFGASVLNWRFTVSRGHGALVAERRAFGLVADAAVQGEVAHLPPDPAHAATAEFLIGNTQNIRMQSGIPLFPRGTGASARAVFALARNRPLGRSTISGRLVRPHSRRVAGAEAVHGGLHGVEDAPCPACTRRVMGIAAAVVNWAWKNGEIDRQIPIVLPPEGEGGERIMTIREMARLWATDMPSHLRMFLALLIGTASRPEALLQLTREQCDLGHGVIDLNPPGRARTKKRRPRIPMPEFLRSWIESVPSGHLVTYKDKPILKIN